MKYYNIQNSEIISNDKLKTNCISLYLRTKYITTIIMEEIIKKYKINKISFSFENIPFSLIRFYFQNKIQ